jgi:hypothetical protein
MMLSGTPAFTHSLFLSKKPPRNLDIIIYILLVVMRLRNGGDLTTGKQLGSGQIRTKAKIFQLHSLSSVSDMKLGLHGLGIPAPGISD